RGAPGPPPADDCRERAVRRSELVRWPTAYRELSGIDSSWLSPSRFGSGIDCRWLQRFRAGRLPRGALRVQGGAGGSGAAALSRSTCAATGTRSVAVGTGVGAAAVGALVE